MKMSSRIMRRSRRQVILAASILVFAATNSCCLADSVDAWGWNAYGQVGDGTTTNRLSPFAIPSLVSGVTVIAAGYAHSLAVQNGAVYAWGYNNLGQIGDGTTTNRLLPVPVSGLAGGVTVIASGYYYDLAVKNGAVYAWGYNAYGQLGDGTTTNRLTPVPVINLASGVTDVAAGAEHNLALKNGAVYAWGDNGVGELGDGTTTWYPTPVAISSLSSGVTAIAAGQAHSLALKNGAVYAWGYNAYGQLGDGTTTNRLSPYAIPSLSSGVTDVAGGQFDSLAVKNGEVYAWGYNANGQLGNGTATNSLLPVRIPGLSNIVLVAAGGGSSYALASDGSLWVWGAGSAGELGLGNGQSHLTPTHLLAPTGYIYTSIDASKAATHVVATLAAIPQTQVVNRTPAVSLTALPSGSLVVFDPNQNIFVPYSTVLGAPGYVDRTISTVVLTHGFNSSSNMWVGNDGFAASLIKSAGTTENILAWDWSSDAGSLSHPSSLLTATYASQHEGQILGTALVTVLGSNYTGSTHFVGHSLGTLVNAQAINTFAFLDATAVISDTLFDDAEKANLLTGTAFTAIPNKDTTAWIDNYISAFGGAHLEAVNVLLYQGATILDPVNFHSYPQSWYQQTIGNTSTLLNGMGFQFNGSQARAGIDPYNFLQSLNASTPLNLSQTTTYADLQTKLAARNVLELGTGPLTAIGKLTIYGITSAIDTIGNVVVNVVSLPPDTFDNSTPMFGPQIRIGKASSPSTLLSPQLSTASISGPTATNMNVSATTPISNSYAWLPITIPEDAQTMSFKFTFSGVSSHDTLSVGINDVPLLLIESQFMVDGVVNDSGYIDITEWSGQNVSLFLGLLASDENNMDGTVTVDSFRFQAIPEPGTMAILLLTTMCLVGRRTRYRRM